MYDAPRLKISFYLLLFLSYWKIAYQAENVYGHKQWDYLYLYLPTDAHIY